LDKKFDQHKNGTKRKMLQKDEQIEMEDKNNKKQLENNVDKIDDDKPKFGKNPQIWTKKFDNHNN